MITSLINWLQHFTATDYYHAAAFVLTGAGSVYSIQLVRILKKNKLSKNILRGLNLVFNALYTAAAAVVSGGISLGSDTKTVLALTAFSAGYYRFHNSFLFKKAEELVNDAPATGVEAPVVPISQFAE